MHQKLILANLFSGQNNRKGLDTSRSLGNRAIVTWHAINSCLLASVRKPYLANNRAFDKNMVLDPVKTTLFKENTLTTWKISTVKNANI